MARAEAGSLLKYGRTLDKGPRKLVEPSQILESRNSPVEVANLLAEPQGSLELAGRLCGQASLLQDDAEVAARLRQQKRSAFVACALASGAKA